MIPDLPLDPDLPPALRRREFLRLLGAAGVATGLLFDHALEHAGDKRHTCGFDGLQIQRCEQTQGMVVGVVGVGGGQDGGGVTQARGRQVAHALGGIGQGQQFAAGQGQGRQVVHAIGLYPHQHRPGAGQPKPPDQQCSRVVRWECVS